jgi:hypothetical protein
MPFLELGSKSLNFHFSRRRTDRQKRDVTHVTTFNVRGEAPTTKISLLFRPTLNFQIEVVALVFVVQVSCNFLIIIDSRHHPSQTISAIAFHFLVQ